MARHKFASPTLEIKITSDDYETAKQAQSGTCLIADAIKRQYPELTNVAVDIATIRLSDRKRGERYTYLTPPDAQQILLFFDQGWPNRIEELTIRRAVKIDPIKRAPQQAAAREERRRKLEEKVASGAELTSVEKRALTTMQRTPTRPTRDEKPSVKAGTSRPIVRGGQPLKRAGDANPNLLHGTDRHFGAKLANPGVVFQEAVDKAVELKLAEQAAG